MRTCAAPKCRERLTGRAGQLTCSPRCRQAYKRRSRPHVSRNTGDEEWYTPAYIIEAARQCMGGIDLDPCSCEYAQATVKAARYFTKADDGLMQTWAGRVWMNPPYTRQLVDAFVTKLVSEPVDQAVVLVNNATETGWGQALLRAASAYCLVTSRVRFVKSSGRKGAPLQGQMIAAIGVDIEAFTAAFGGIGLISVTETARHLSHLGRAREGTT